MSQIIYLQKKALYWRFVLLVSCYWNVELSFHQITVIRAAKGGLIKGCLSVKSDFVRLN